MFLVSAALSVHNQRVYPFGDKEMDVRWPSLFGSLIDHFAVALTQLDMFPFLVFCHVLQVTLKLYQLPGFARQYWLKTWIVTFCVAFGGSTLAHLLCGKAVPWVTSPNDRRLIITTWIAWWLVHRLCWFFSLVSRWSLLRATIAGFAAVAKARSVMQFVDNVHKWYPIGGNHGGILATVVLGTVAGCGGNLFLVLEEKLRCPAATVVVVSELSRPTSSNLKSAFYISLIYAISRRKKWQYGSYLSLQWDQVLSISRVYKYVCGLMFVHGWWEGYTGNKLLDKLLFPVERVACSLFRWNKEEMSSGKVSMEENHEPGKTTTSALAYVKQYSPMKKRSS